MDFSIICTNSVGQMTFDKNTTIATDIYCSLNMKPNSFFQNPSFSNKLFTIKKVTDANVLLAKQYIEQALKWLLQLKKATSITVIVEKDSKDFNRINFKITAIQPDNVTVYYQQFYNAANGTLQFTPVGGTCL
jgi:phage gp46-like protein